MKTAKVSLVLKIGNHQYGSQGETAYLATLSNGQTCWLIGFGGDHRTATSQEEQNITDRRDIVPDSYDEELADGMIGGEIEISTIVTATATFSIQPTTSYGRYRLTVSIEDETYNTETNDSIMYDAIRGAEPEDEEAIDAMIEGIRKVLDDNGVGYDDVRHEFSQRGGHIFEVDMEDEG